MDYAEVHELFIPTHGVFGVLALVSGSVALALPKRRPWHPWAGRSFLVAMGLAILIASPVIYVGRNQFLVGITLLVVYHGAVAWRLARLKPPARRPSRLDRAVHPVFAVVFGVFLLYGVRLLFRGVPMGTVPVVLSLVSLASVRHFYRFMGKTEFEPGAWLPEHIRGMATAFIASVTAFSAATGPRLVPDLPQIVLWLGPTALITPVFMWFGSQFRSASVRRRT